MYKLRLLQYVLTIKNYDKYNAYVKQLFWVGSGLQWGPQACVSGSLGVCGMHF